MTSPGPQPLPSLDAPTSEKAVEPSFSSLGRGVLEAVGPFLGLLLVVIFFSLAIFARDCWRWKQSPAGKTESVGTFLGKYQNRFLTAENARSVVSSSVMVAMAALGMLVVIIGGGIDLSVGTAVAFCSVVLARALKADIPWPLAILLGIGTGVACGLLNGALISVLKVVPFIATLGTMMIYLGLAKHYANNTAVRLSVDQIPDWLETLTSSNAKHEFWCLPVGAWLLLFMACIVATLLHLTSFGRYVFAVGSNEATARICGVNVPLVRIAIYGIGGLFAGIGGLYLFARIGQGNPTSGSGLELKAIAAVVIGGASLSGGRGSIAGTLAGAMMMATILSGCTFLGISDAIKDVLLGTIIVVSAAIDRFRTSRVTN